MKHLTYFDVCHVIAGLRQEAEAALRAQSLLPDQYDYYQKQYEQVAGLVDMFEEVRDRLCRIDLGKSVRITAKW